MLTRIHPSRASPRARHTSTRSTFPTVDQKTPESCLVYTLKAR